MRRGKRNVVAGSRGIDIGIKLDRSYKLHMEEIECNH